MSHNHRHHHGPPRIVPLLTLPTTAVPLNKAGERVPKLLAFIQTVPPELYEKYRLSETSALLFDDTFPINLNGIVPQETFRTFIIRVNDLRAEFYIKYVYGVQRFKGENGNSAALDWCLCLRDCLYCLVCCIPMPGAGIPAEITVNDDVTGQPVVVKPEDVMLDIRNKIKAECDLLTAGICPPNAPPPVRFEVDKYGFTINVLPKLVS